MSNIAYRKKNMLMIKQRENEYKHYLDQRDRTRKEKNRPDFNFDNRKASIVVVPGINNIEILTDIVNRFCWYLPDCERADIFIPVHKELLNIDLETLVKPEDQGYFIFNNPSIYLIDKKDMKNHMDSDLILLHDFKHVFKPLVKPYIDRTIIVDKWFYSHIESLNWIQLNRYIQDNKSLAVYEQISRENFRTFFEKQKEKRAAYCFTTGPSFDMYNQLDYKENSLNVICNSIVKNEGFLNRIQPDLLVFGDPVFHFGPSEYAAEFRVMAADVLEKFDCHAIVEQKYMPYLLKIFPHLKDKLIGMNIQFEENFPTSEKDRVKASKNILTLYMLPVASALTDEIFVIGADGRQPDEKYFWKHNPSVQMDDLMESVFNTHPSFFRDRLYEDYYEEHCEYLEQLLQYGENKGKKYESLTPSYIPSLSKRYVGEAK